MIARLLDILPLRPNSAFDGLCLALRDDGQGHIVISYLRPSAAGWPSRLSRLSIYIVKTTYVEYTVIDYFIIMELLFFYLKANLLATKSMVNG